MFFQFIRVVKLFNIPDKINEKHGYYFSVYITVEVFYKRLRKHFAEIKSRARAVICYRVVDFSVDQNARFVDAVFNAEFVCRDIDVCRGKTYGSANFPTVNDLARERILLAEEIVRLFNFPLS